MAQRGPTYQDGRCAYLLHQLRNLRTMLDPTYRTTRKFKTTHASRLFRSQVQNEKLERVQQAYPVRVASHTVVPASRSTRIG